MTASRLSTAYQQARQDLLAERVAAGHWVGELSTSALSTATAVSALALVERHGATDSVSGRFRDESNQSRLSELILRGIGWLADNQNPDGGWGDTNKSYSNIATTMLAVAAFHLTGVPARHADLLQRAERYIDQQGGLTGLRRRYGRDKTFAVPILTNYALAGLVDWRHVSPLPFELACLPQEWYRFMRLPVVSYAIPALVAIGQARYFHRPPWDPIRRLIRRAAVAKSLAVLRQIQPASGGYLEAVPLTSFVVMSLAATQRAEHPVAEQGTQFLLDSVRADGSWPIDTNLATWNTTLALNALATGGEDIGGGDIGAPGCIDWLLDCQYTERHPFSGADPGGWGWSDLSGAVPDADDTPGALLALRQWIDSPSCATGLKRRIERAAQAGIVWLMGLQNRDGGWPTFCRGWGKLPFDRSGADLTAHALRAIRAWTPAFSQWQDELFEGDADLARRAESATRSGLAYLARQQRSDGSWVPLWFGNQDHPDEENPIYGTAKVLLAYDELGQIETPAAQRGLQWLVGSQHPQSGGWGGSPPAGGSVEETALAVEALCLAPQGDESRQSARLRGVEWLVEATLAGRHRETSPIGFYFAKLWYHEKLYPQVFTVSALGRALRIQANLPPTSGLPATPVTATPTPSR